MSPEHKRLVDGGAHGEGEQGAAELLERSGPVPQNDDIARERVWRALQKNLPESKKRAVRWVWPVLAASAVAAALLVFVLSRPAEAPFARIELTAGPVFTAMPERAWASAQAGTELRAASRVKTDAASRTLIRLPRSALMVSQSTDVGLESLGKDTFVRLTGGEVLAEVEHRAPDETFVIQTTRYKVTVRGTVFSVHERAADDVTVSVSRGLVEVTGEGGVWQVPAGKSWHSRSADVLGADEITANDRALVASVANDAPRALIRVEGTAGVQVSEGGMVLGPAPVTWTAPVGQYHFSGAGEQGAFEVDATTTSDQPATVQLKTIEPKTNPSPETTQVIPSPETGEGARRADEGDLPQAVAQTVPPRHHPHRASTPHHDTVATKPLPPPAPEPRVELASPPPPSRPIANTTPAEETPAITEPAPIATPHPTGTATGIDRPAPPPAPPSDPYTDAIKLERAHSYAEAAALFAKVADEHGPRSGAALYELGVIQKSNLGHATDALATFNRYEREFPKGTLIQEAELSVIEIELQQKSYDDALTNLNSFLSNHSKSERASEVHLERAELYRERGDCAKALDDYSKAKAPGQLDDSLYFSAWCEQKLGDRDAAEKSFGIYLERFPNGRHAAQARTALGEK